VKEPTRVLRFRKIRGRAVPCEPALIVHAGELFQNEFREHRHHILRRVHPMSVELGAWAANR